MVVAFHIEASLNTGNLFKGQVEVDIQDLAVTAVRFKDEDFKEFAPSFEDNVEIQDLIEKKARCICFGD